MIDRVPGFLMPGQERYLFEKVRSLPDDAVIVEIGSYYGRSSCALGLACVGSNRRIFCIDPWRMLDLGNLDFFEHWEANVRSCGVRELITPLRGKSHDVLARWKELAGGAPIDFIFIDGWHEYGPVLRDLQLAFPLVKDGGWIAMHDVIESWPGSLRVWNETAKPSLSKHEKCGSISCGMKTPGLALRDTPWQPDPPKTALPVHYFTHVTAEQDNDLASIPAMLQTLDFPWCWHVILPGPLGANDHAVTKLARGEVRLHAPPAPRNAWKDQIEARNVMLGSIGHECILWELNSRDRWTHQQLSAGRALYVDEPMRTAAWFKRTADDRPAGRPLAWHFYPWFTWINPSVPALVANVANGGWYDAAHVRPFTAAETASLGATSRLFPHRITTSDVADAVKLTRTRYPDREIVVLHDGAPLVDGVRAIDCRSSDVDQFASQTDFAKTAFVYACSEHHTGGRFVRCLIDRGGVFIPAWTFGPAKYIDHNAIAHRVLEAEWNSQAAEGFAKWDSGPGDFLNLCQALEITRHVRGAFLEIGCYRGSSGSVALHYMNEAHIHRDAYFFDVFDGFSYDAAKQSADAIWANSHATEGIDTVRARLKRHERADRGLNVFVTRHNIVEEEIPNTIDEIAVANIDVDLYEAVKVALFKVAPRMSTNGIMIVEDPGHTPALVGARVALDEFLASDVARNFIPIHLESGQTFLIRKDAA